MDLQQLVFTVGWWLEDMPFGKQIVFQGTKESTFEIYKQGLFLCRWNDFRPENILKSEQSFLNNKEGLHTTLEPLTSDMITQLKKSQMDDHLRLLEIFLRNQMKLE